MNGPNTHSTALIIEGIGIAFVDGIPDNCDHDYKDDVYESASGKLIYWHTYKQWASLTDAAYRYRLIWEHHNSIGDPIVVATSQCRKCKKIYTPDIHSMP
jgi:hypothetical protein